MRSSPLNLGAMMAAAALSTLASVPSSRAARPRPRDDEPAQTEQVPEDEQFYYDKSRYIRETDEAYAKRMERALWNAKVDAKNRAKGKRR